MERDGGVDRTVLCGRGGHKVHRLHKH
jgi:hypothetical protein